MRQHLIGKDVFSYTVCCSFSASEVAASWLRWLHEEHIQDVLDAGASSAEIFKMEDGLTYEVRYQFSSRLEFEQYERDHAPRLRQEGLQKFPLELGLAYSRTTGQRESQHGV